MEASAALNLPSYTDAYAANYAATIVACERVGTLGASIMTFRCPAGSYHNGASADFAVTMVENGGYRAHFDFGMGPFSVHIAPGQLLLSQPFIPADQHFSGAARGVVIALPHSRAAELLRAVNLTPERAFRDLYSRSFSDDFIRASLNQLLAMLRLPQRADKLLADTAIAAIFATLARRGADISRKAKKGLADWQLRRAMEKLSSMGECSLAELAASANLSPFYFARAFKHTTGLPPHHYQQRLRIERAKDLLATTGLSVTDIALRVGYGSSQTLARVFRRNVGSTPAEYRRSLAG